jgi:hypothetical protein
MLGVHPTILTEITRQTAIEREQRAAQARRAPRRLRRSPRLVPAPPPARRARFARDGG